jgi:hypothetical protein
MQDFEKCYEGWLNQLSKIALDFTGCESIPDIDKKRISGISVDDKNELSVYRNLLEDMINKLFKLNNVYPMARLHDCQEINEENPTVTLNETSLGTF